MWDIFCCAKNILFFVKKCHKYLDFFSSVCYIFRITHPCGYFEPCIKLICVFKIVEVRGGNKKGGKKNVSSINETIA